MYRFHVGIPGLVSLSLWIHLYINIYSILSDIYMLILRKISVFYAKLDFCVNYAIITV